MPILKALVIRSPPKLFAASLFNFTKGEYSANRKRPVFLSSVAAIAEGHAHADMIQDLNDIAVPGKETLDPWKQSTLI